MRKRLLAILLSTCMLLSLLPATALAVDEPGTLQAQINGAADGATVALTGDATESITIAFGKNITLNLAGHTLTNTAGQHTITNNGTLTITGTGTVDNVSHGKAAVFNTQGGEIDLCGGVYTRSAEAGSSPDNSGKNSFYTLQNYGTMTIEKGVTVNQGADGAGHFSSLIENGYYDGSKETNTPKMTINGGTFSGGLNTIKNDDRAELVINDGTFSNVTQNVVMNYHKATINGGTFSNNGADKPLISNTFADANADAGKLTITGGNFTGTGALFTYGNGFSDAGTIDISGGTFKYNGNFFVATVDNNTTITGGTFSGDVSQYIPDGYTQNEDGVVGTLGETNAVAQVGENYYKTLAAAITAADNQTVTLLRDTTVEQPINVEKTITLHLNGKRLTVPKDGLEVEQNGNVTLTGNGTLTANSERPVCVDGGQFTLESGTVKSTGTYGVYVMSGGTVTVTGGAIESKDSCLAGNNTTGNMNFYVKGGTLTPESGPAIYMPGQVNLEISGGTLNGGVMARMGTITITGGEIINSNSSNADTFEQYWDYSGNVWYPNALTVYPGSYSSASGNGLTLTISDDAKLTSTLPGSHAVAVYVKDEVAATSTVTISGGYFSSTDSAYEVIYARECAGLHTSHTNSTTTKYTGKLGEKVNTVTTALTGGYFTSDPSEYLATEKMVVPSTLDGYHFNVVDKAANAAEVVPAPPAANTELTGTPTEEDLAMAESVETALTTSENKPSLSQDLLNAAANEVAQKNKVVVDNTLTTSMNGQGVNTTGKTITIVVQPYMDIKITAMDAASKTLTLDITPMYQKVATTANVTAPSPEKIIVEPGDSETKNAVILPKEPGETCELDLTGQTVTVRIPLPEGFIEGGVADDNTRDAYVGHKGYAYPGFLKTGNVLEFTTGHGFSEFVIGVENVAQIGNTTFASLEGAVDALINGEKTGDIVLQVGNTEKFSVSSNVTFTVDANEKEFNPDNITAGSGYTMTKTTVDGKTTYTFVKNPSSGGGSSGGSTTYAVTVADSTNGAVTVSPKSASKGDTVTITVKPNDGYELDKLVVTDKDGKEVKLTDKGDGKYTFTMPGAKVELKATFAEIVPEPLPFVDVPDNAWYADAVGYAYQNGMMNGTSQTTFSPDLTTSRGMIVTILYRAEGSPAVQASSDFQDVSADQYYADAVAWASDNGIVGGYGNGNFGPNDPITREQMAAILFRYAQYKGMTAATLEENLIGFPDHEEISGYAVQAMNWAVGKGLINGTDAGTLAPRGNATRAQVAVILMRFCENIIK